MLKHMRFLGGLLAATLALPSAGIAAGEAGQGYTIERFSINVSVPPGYCALDPAHPSDAILVRTWQAFAAGEQMVRVAVECGHLHAWRLTSRIPLDFTRFMVVSGSRFEGLPYEQRANVSALMCRSARDLARQPLGETKASFDSRVTAVLAALKPEEEKMVGVVDEDPRACFAVAVARGQTTGGPLVSVLHVRATVIIKGRVLNLFQTAHTPPGKEMLALRRAAETLKHTVQANFAANQ